MTAFDLFQIATCEIAAGKHEEAAATLTAAIDRIDSDILAGKQIDVEMRACLVGLRKSLIVQVVS